MPSCAATAFDPAGVIRAGQDGGVIRADFPATDLARSLVATIEGGIMLSRLTKDEAPLRVCLASLRAMLTACGPRARAGIGRRGRRPVLG